MYVQYKADNHSYICGSQFLYRPLHYNNIIYTIYLIHTVFPLDYDAIHTQYCAMNQNTPIKRLQQ